MAMTAIDSSSSSSSNYLQLDSLPIVDLNSLTQSELNSLSLCSNDAFDFRQCDDLVIPKIDRSVFNESAGGRKQTYSRLRLVPRQSEITSPSRSVHKNNSNSAEDSERRENSEQIVNVLRRLLGRGDPAIDLGAVDRERRGRKRGRRKKDCGLGGAEDVRVLDIVVSEKCSDFDVAALENVEDPFSVELRRRTVGLEAAVEFLGFLGGLEGQWGSQRKKRRIVDAGEFGDYLPKGWKLLLSLKRKQGRVSLYCRRYISSNGQQFASWKDVSSYLTSIGLQNSYLVNPCHSDDVGHWPYKMASGSVSALAPKIGHTGKELRHCTKSPEQVTLLNADALIDVEVLSMEANKFQLNDTKVMNREPECALRNTHSNSDMDFTRDTVGRNDEKNVLGTLLADTSLPQVRSLSSFCRDDMAVEKGQDDFSNFNKNPGNTSTAEELTWDTKEPLRTSSASASRSLREEPLPMDLADYTDIKEELENPDQFECEGVLPKMANNKQLYSVCIWCGVDFKHEVVKPETRSSDSVGFLCPICRAKLSVLDNGLATNPDQP